MRIVVLGVLLSGCALHHVETYAMEGKTAAEVDRAARRAAARLGWEIDASAHGRLRLTDVPHDGGALHAVLEASSEDGRLILEGDRPIDRLRGSPLGPASAVLATQTARELTAQPGTAARPVTRRSKLGAAALDVLLPAVGALYSGLGDPLLTSGAGSWMSHPWAQFGVRLGIDAGAAVLLSTALLGSGGVSAVSWWEWAAIAEMVVFNRVFALFFDLRSIGFRNGWAEGGLPELAGPLLSATNTASR